MNALSQDLPGPDAADLAAASLAMARRFATGATMWCAAPSWPGRSRQLAAELARSVAGGGRSFATAVLPDEDMPDEDMIASLRTHARAGDVLLLAANGGEPSLAGLRQRAAAWGLLTVWIGAGKRPVPGAADYVLWLGGNDAVRAGEGGFGHVGQELGEMIRARLARDELVEDHQAGCHDEVCITCSDEGRLGEIVSLQPDGLAQVRTPSGIKTVDTSLVDARAGDLVLIHAGTALSLVVPQGCEPEEAP